jgi:NAD(P)H dehydrogenase (quinone)
VLDLHREDFNPVLRVHELAVYGQGRFFDPRVGDYQRRTMQADHLIHVFAVWWEVMPAMLKGFFDKVFLPEWAFRECDAAPLLTHIKTGTAITTMGAPMLICTSVETVLCKGILEFSGVQKTHWFNICEVGAKTQTERLAWLNGIEIFLRTLS